MNLASSHGSGKREKTIKNLVPVGPAGLETYSVTESVLEIVQVDTETLQICIVSAIRDGGLATE